MLKGIPARHEHRASKQIAVASQAQMNFQSHISSLLQATFEVPRPALLFLFMNCTDNTGGTNSTYLLKIMLHHSGVQEGMKVGNSSIHHKFSSVDFPASGKPSMLFHKNIFTSGQKIHNFTRNSIASYHFTHYRFVPV